MRSAAYVGLALLILLVIAPSDVFAQSPTPTTTVIPLPSWQRSTEASGSILVGSIGSTAAAALTLPLDAAQPVFDNGTFTAAANITATPAGNQWSSWPQWYGACFGDAETRHLRTTFTLPTGLGSVVDVILFSPYYSNQGNIIPINDNVYVFLNGTAIGQKGYSYGSTNAGLNGAAPFANETDGWYQDGSLGPGAGAALQPGVNVIDVVAEEICDGGGMGRLDLKLITEAPTAHFTYIGSGDSVAAGQDIDGQDIGTGRSPFAYPTLIADALCAEPPSGMSCANIFAESIAVSAESTSDFLSSPDPFTNGKGQFEEIKNQQPDLVTATIGIDGIMVPAVSCILDAENRWHFLSNIRTSAYISAVAGDTSGCLTGLFLSIQDRLDSVQIGLETIRAGLLGFTSANAVFTTYYNPIRTTGVWGYGGRTFADFIGSVNSFVGLQVVQDPSRLALADLGPAFVGHEIGTSCSYIERLNNLPLLPFGVHPNKLGQRVIAGVVLKTARDKGFISGSSSPVATCITGQVQPGQVITMSGVDLQPGLSVSINGTRTDVINVSPGGYSATLQIPEGILVGVGAQADVIIKNPNGPAKTFRVDVVSLEVDQ